MTNNMQDLDPWVPPHNIEAEESLLGAMLISHSAAPVAMDIVGVDDFFRDNHRAIFRAMQALFVAGKSIDTITVAGEMDKQGTLQEVGRDTIRTLPDLCPVVGNAAQYAELVKQAAVLRSLAVAGKEIADLGYNGTGDVAQLMERAEALLYGVRGANALNESEDLTTLLLLEAKRIEDAASGKKDTGFSSTFGSIDDIIGGFQPGNLIILAARPSVGKSALALNMAQHMAMYHRVGFFSLEMSARELTERMVCSDARVGLTKKRAGVIDTDEHNRLIAALNHLSTLQLEFDTTSNLTMMSLRSKVRRMATRSKLDLVVVDYLQLMNMGAGHKENRNYELSDITRSMKGLAREFNVPMLVLSQLSRPDKTLSYTPKPRLSDLRDSGAIEQDADMVLFLHRYEKKDEPVDLTDIEFICGKHRNGPLGEVHLRYTPKYTLFKDRI